MESFWKKLEEKTELILSKHSSEVHAVANALLERNDLTGKQCIEIIRSAATESEPVDSELLLKSLVEETIVNGRLVAHKPKPKKRKAATRAKGKVK